MAETNTSQDTAIGDPAQTGNWEQRYKDLQASFTKNQQTAAQKEAELKQLQQTLDTVTPFVDWDKAMGRTKPAQTLIDPTTIPDDDMNQNRRNPKYISEDELNNRLAVIEAETHFRLANPDLLEHEDIVAVFLRKTDARKPMSERIKIATQQTREFFASQRQKGIEEYKAGLETEKKKAAESAGLIPGTAGLDPEAAEKKAQEDNASAVQKYIQFRANRNNNKMSVNAVDIPKGP